MPMPKESRACARSRVRSLEHEHPKTRLSAIEHVRVPKDACVDPNR